MRIRRLWRARGTSSSCNSRSQSSPPSNGSYPNSRTAPTPGRVYAATAAKSSGGSSEEKGLLDWILGGLQKEDQLLETDPILKKVEEKNGGTTGRKNSVAVPLKKKAGGFGGLFAKN